MKKRTGTLHKPDFPDDARAYTRADVIEEVARAVATQVGFSKPKPFRFVYFITAGDAGPIKIGTCSGSITARLKALQTAHYETLSVIGWIRGGLKEERELHRRFAHLHIRAEWFRRADDLLVYIAENAERRRQRRTEGMRRSKERKVAERQHSPVVDLANDEEAKIAFWRRHAPGAREAAEAAAARGDKRAARLYREMADGMERGLREYDARNGAASPMDTTNRKT